MLKLRPWLLALLLAIITILIVTRSETFKDCVQESKPQSSQQNLQEYFSRSPMTIGTVFDEHGEAVIAAFTVILAFSTIFLWAATRDLVAGAERTAERQLRAYVFIEEANLVYFDEVPVAQVLFKNAGQTPAYHFVAWNAVRLATFPLDLELRQPADADTNRAFIGPGMKANITTKLARLSEPRKNAIREGSAALYVFGRADYIDAFGHKQYLKWRLYFGAESAARSDGGLSLHPEGNDAS
jgi:hypothetical protein